MGNGFHRLFVSLSYSWREYEPNRLGSVSELWANSEGEVANCERIVNGRAEFVRGATGSGKWWWADRAVRAPGKGAAHGFVHGREHRPNRVDAVSE